MSELFKIINNTLVKAHDITDLLEKMSIESEHQFIKLGNNLQEIFTAAKGLTALTRETAMLLDGSSDKNILGNIGVFTKESLSRLNTCREDVVNVLPKVEAYSTNLKRLHDMCPIIKNIAKKLNIVALHIAIESSRSRECEEMFSFFVHEIRGLANRVNAISVKIFENAENAKYRQISDFNSFAQKKDSLNVLADSAHRSVEANIHEIENLVNISLNAMRRAETHSKKLYSLVGEIVVAIQFHDITRQQIEHIVQSLEEIVTILNPERNGESALTEYHDSALAKVYALLNLQAEQLDQVIKEIRGSYYKIKQSFNEIDNEIQSLVNDMIDLCQNTENSCGNINPFQQLTAGLFQLDKIMKQGNEMAGMIDSNLKQSAETAHNMADQLTQMKDISTDLHIKAINALIMSKRLDSNGKTLSVLAEDVTEVSLESNEFVLDVVEILNAIEGLTINFSNISIPDEAPVENNNLTDLKPSSGNDLISAIYADYLSKSKLSKDRSKMLQDKISLLETEIDFFNKIESTLSCQKEEINRLMEGISPFISKDNLVYDELKHLNKRYTMEIERGIHSRTLGKDKSINVIGSSDRKRPDSIESDETDYIDDNVELF